MSENKPLLQKSARLNVSVLLTWKLKWGAEFVVTRLVAPVLLMFSVSVFWEAGHFVDVLMLGFPNLNNVKFFDYKFNSSTVGWWLTENSFYLPGKSHIV